MVINHLLHPGMILQVLKVPKSTHQKNSPYLPWSTQVHSDLTGGEVGPTPVDDRVNVGQHGWGAILGDAMPRCHFRHPWNP